MTGLNKINYYDKNNNNGAKKKARLVGLAFQVEHGLVYVGATIVARANLELNQQIVHGSGTGLPLAQVLG